MDSYVILLHPVLTWKEQENIQIHLCLGPVRLPPMWDASHVLVLICALHLLCIIFIILFIFLVLTLGFTRWQVLLSVVKFTWAHFGLSIGRGPNAPKLISQSQLLEERSLPYPTCFHQGVGSKLGGAYFQHVSTKVLGRKCGA